MNIENLKEAVATYVAACRGILHDAALVFVQAVEAYIKEVEFASEPTPKPEGKMAEVVKATKVETE